MQLYIQSSALLDLKKNDMILSKMEFLIYVIVQVTCSSCYVDSVVYSLRKLYVWLLMLGNKITVEY